MHLMHSLSVVWRVETHQTAQGIIIRIENITKFEYVDRSVVICNFFIIFEEIIINEDFLSLRIINDNACISQRFYSIVLE